MELLYVIQIIRLAQRAMETKRSDESRSLGVVSEQCDSFKVREPTLFWNDPQDFTDSSRDPGYDLHHDHFSTIKARGGLVLNQIGRIGFFRNRACPNHLASPV